ncbi:MAG: methionine--tRNA ligase [Spirochaetaceae bacterium]|jgi:methionyl-tRNA synthetase|nr:methionine--tRNA ligase [Spirochaetaceae bacterium]
MKQRLITSALPYVNNVPHLGNLIQVLSADCFARFCRLSGYETLYICGTDEYGTATETRAAEEGISPQALCDRYHALHASIYEWFGIAFDHFGRTSTAIQTEVVQHLFHRLYDAGFIVEHTTEQPYCPVCQRFLADRYVRGTCPACGNPDARGDQCEACGKVLDPTELHDPHCSTCGAPPVIKATNHLYLDLPKIKDRLEAWMQFASIRGSWAYNAIQMTRSWIRDGLRERAITRDLSWGIPVPHPGYEHKVFYVWFDAPIGYISITGSFGERQGEDWHKTVERWWKAPNKVELFQFIGKDNIPFHTVIFPSTLLGSGENWTLLHHMSSTEYLNYEAGKFSKSKGIGVFGTDVMDTGIPADVWRFYIFYNRPEKADALFTWKDFQEKVNGELIGNLGNLINRTLTFVKRYYDGTIPQSSRDDMFWEVVEAYEDDISERLDRAELRDGFRKIFELSSFGNKVFQDAEPWHSRTIDPEYTANLIHNLCYLLRDLAILIEPYLPTTARKIASFWGLEFGKDGLNWSSLGTDYGLGQVIESEVLFSRLDDSLIASLRERYAGAQSEREQQAAPAPDPAFVFSHTVDLRVATITAISRHPKADKLYIETLDLGGEERTIVSGLVPFYRAEELLGKRIIVVYNLKPAKLRGVESRGMLLAVSSHDDAGAERVEVLDAGTAAPGTRLCLAGVDAGKTPAEIDLATFGAIPLVVKDGTVTVAGHTLTAADLPIKTQTILDGEVH